MRLAVNDPEAAAQAFYFINVALVRLFSLPDNQFLNMSYSAVASCQAMEEICVINIKDICSVFGMIPHSVILAGGERQSRFFILEQPGLNITHFFGPNDEDNDLDDGE
jgi:hypothetical protein